MERSATELVTRREKSNGAESTVMWAFAVDILADHYHDPAAALDGATEACPAQTSFAVYWPVSPKVADR